MFITQTYKYINNNIVYVGGEIPESAEMLDIMDILNAEEDYVLVRISDNENVGPNIWLRDDDLEENYKEIAIS